MRAMRDTLTYQHIRISKLSFELHRVAMKTRWERQAAQKLLNMTTLSPDMVIVSIFVDCDRVDGEKM